MHHVTLSNLIGAIFIAALLVAIIFIDPDHPS